MSASVRELAWMLQLTHLALRLGSTTSEGRNSKELTGTRTSGGACGLIRATRRTLPNLDILYNSRDKAFPFGDKVTGGAWLSSARVVRCWVKSRKPASP